MTANKFTLRNTSPRRFVLLTAIATYHLFVLKYSCAYWYTRPSSTTPRRVHYTYVPIAHQGFVMVRPQFHLLLRHVFPSLFHFSRVLLTFVPIYPSLPHSFSVLLCFPTNRTNISARLSSRLLSRCRDSLILNVRFE